MKRSRVSIARLMGVVAAVALNCAMLRSGLIDPGLLLMVPLLEVGLFRMISSRGKIRPYWVGFEVVGGAATLAYYAGLRDSMGIGLMRGLTHLTNWLQPTHPGFARGLFSLFMGDNLVIGMWLEALILGLPMLLLALLGGRLARRRARALADGGPTDPLNPFPEVPACAS
jgi:hypothetical protein